MSRKQTRRSISVSGDVYDRLRAWCEQNNRSMSGLVEDEVRKFLDMEPRSEHLARPFVSTVEKTISVESPVVEPPVPEVKEEVCAPTRVDVIREVAEAKKPSVPLSAIDAAAKIFTF